MSGVQSQLSIQIVEYLMLAAYIIFGLIVGSFLSVCIYRIPYGREKGPPKWEELSETEGEAQSGGEAASPHESEGEESASRRSFNNPPRSICPSCNNQLRWYHNIPVISWLFLKGRCAFCSEPISVRYPLVELLASLFCLLSFGLHGFSATGAVIFVFSCALLVISLIDIDYYIIPDVISLPGTLLGLLLALINTLSPGIFSPPIVQSLGSSLIGVLVGGGTLLLISELYFRLRKRIGLGMGDVKLLAMTGAFFGAEGAIFSMFIGSLAGSIIGLFIILLFRKNMSYQLPFGPYLAFGTLLYIFNPNSSLIGFF